MKCFLLLIALAAMVLAESFFYETKGENLDVDAILKDPIELQSYIDCFLDRTPCNPVAASIKSLGQDVVIGACDRCSTALRQRFAKFVWFIRENLPHEYINIRQKYDPTGLYYDRFEAVLANYVEPKTTPIIYYFWYKK